jgi:hypothetical protein
MEWGESALHLRQARKNFYNRSECSQGSFHRIYFSPFKWSLSRHPADDIKSRQRKVIILVGCFISFLEVIRLSFQEEGERDHLLKSDKRTAVWELEVFESKALYSDILPRLSRILPSLHLAMTITLVILVLSSDIFFYQDIYYPSHLLLDMRDRKPRRMRKVVWERREGETL